MSVASDTMNRENGSAPVTPSASSGQALSEVEGSKANLC